MSTPSQEPTKKSSKRKSLAGGAPEASTSDVKVIVSEPSTSVGPAFVNFPSVRPSKNTPFTVYSRDPSSSVAEITKQQTVIAGETEDVEYFSTNRGQNSALASEGNDCQYLPAIYDPTTKTLQVYQSTPLYLLTHRVKRLRTAVGATNKLSDRSEWRAKKNDLGEVFGTRKAKSQIKAEERNRVDVGAMEGVKGHLMESIGEIEVVDDGPTLPSENIPIPNTQTDDPSQVYTRESLIPSSEWTAIDVSQIIKAKDDKGRISALPWRRSRWIEDKLRVTVEGPKEVRKSNLKLLYYLSTLLAFNSFAPQLSKTSPSELTTKFPGVPPQILNGVIQRFSQPTSSTPGPGSGGQTKRYTVTETAKVRLLAWICCLYLMIDGWAIEVGKVAKDLGLPPAKIQTIYKSLGCQVDIATPAEREKQGLTMAAAQSSKRAVLKAPVEFPKLKRRGPVKR